MTIDTDVFRRNLLKYTSFAFSLLPKIDKPAILDAGCGSGIPTICLAQISGGTVVGVDIDGEVLAKLDAKIREINLYNQVTIINSPIEKMPFEKHTFDIVWAEGSIAHLGFGNALKILGDYVRDGGFLVIHDDASDFMKKIIAVESAELKLYGFFLLPETIWWNEYYTHIEEELKKLTSAQYPFELKGLALELEQFKKNPKKYASAFFIMMKVR